MFLLKKAHLGEVSARVWPKVFTGMCARHGIPVIE
jgi:asparagine synthetase A